MSDFQINPDIRRVRDSRDPDKCWAFRTDAAHDYLLGSSIDVFEHFAALGVDEKVIAFCVGWGMTFSILTSELDD